MNRGQRLLFSLLTATLTALVIGAAGEVIVRLTVPEETFWPVSNIYRPSEIPGAVYTYKPNFEGTAFGVDLETNRLGFRGPEWSRAKADDTFRVALVGDSHAFAFGVPFDLSVGEELASILSEETGAPAEVLNFGINGYNAEQQRAVLEHVALDFSPDLVVLMPTNNDHEVAFRSDLAGWLHWDGEVGNTDSRIVDNSIDEVEPRDVSGWLSQSRLFLYLKLMQRRLASLDESQAQRDVPEEQFADGDWMGEFLPGPIPERLAEPVYEPYKEMLAMSRDRGVPVIIAFAGNDVGYRQMLQHIEQELGVPVLELMRLFPEARTPDELRSQFGLGWDPHLNAAAHRRFAEGIADVIRTRGHHPAWR